MRQPVKRFLLAAALLAALVSSAAALDRPKQEAFVNAVNHSRATLAEICCTSDSKLTAGVGFGRSATRYSHWNGFDLTTRKGTDRLLEDLAQKMPRHVWISPPCGPDSPAQNANQRTEEQRENPRKKHLRARRIQRNVLVLVEYLMLQSWCETVTVEQSDRCRSVCSGGVLIC